MGKGTGQKDNFGLRRGSTYLLQSIIDLIGEGYRVFIVADCVGSRVVYNKEYAIQRAVQEGAFVTTCEGALYEMTQGAGTPHFKAISKLTK